jgi:hypothetical protein
MAPITALLPICLSIALILSFNGILSRTIRLFQFLFLGPRIPIPLLTSKCVHIPETLVVSIGIVPTLPVLAYDVSALCAKYLG